MVTAPIREPRPDKVAAVAALSERLSECPAVLFTEYRGLSVTQQQALRRALGEAGAEYKVVKCTLARRAVHEVDRDDVVAFLEGPVALVFCGADVTGAAKALAQSRKQMEALVIKGGFLDDRVLTEPEIRALAELPSRDVLLAQLAGTFAAPAGNVAGLLAAPLRDVANLLRALEQRKGEGEAA